MTGTKVRLNLSWKEAEEEKKTCLMTFRKKEYLEKKNRNKLKEKNLPMKKKLQLP